MKKINKEEISQEVFDLYDQYAHNQLNRRDFVERLSTYAVGGLTLSALLDYIMPNYQDTIQVAEDDPRLFFYLAHQPWLPLTLLLDDVRLLVLHWR